MLRISLRRLSIVNKSGLKSAMVMLFLLLTSITGFAEQPLSQNPSTAITNSVTIAPKTTAVVPNSVVLAPNAPAVTPNPNVDAQYQQKIDQLEKSQTDLTKELLDLKQNVNDLHSQLSNLQQRQNIWQKYLTDLKSFLNILWHGNANISSSQTLLKFLIWLISIVGIALVLSLLKGDKKVAPHPKVSATENEIDDYDFLGSKEGISAKLDLAKAYIDMEQNDLAKQILEEILTTGNNEQKERAKKLLTQIK